MCSFTTGFKVKVMLRQLFIYIYSRDETLIIQLVDRGIRTSSAHFIQIIAVVVRIT